MDLLLITNDKYVPHVATTLTSIFENNKEMSFDIHIMATDITENNYNKLKSFVQSYNNHLDLKVIKTNELEIDLSVCGKWGFFLHLNYMRQIYILI